MGNAISSGCNRRPATRILRPGTLDPDPDSKASKSNALFVLEVLDRHPVALRNDGTYVLLLEKYDQRYKEWWANGEIATLLHDRRKTYEAEKRSWPPDVGRRTFAEFLTLLRCQALAHRSPAASQEAADFAGVAFQDLRSRHQGPELAAVGLVLQAYPALPKHLQEVLAEREFWAHHGANFFHYAALLGRADVFSWVIKGQWRMDEFAQDEIGRCQMLRERDRSAIADSNAKLLARLAQDLGGGAADFLRGEPLLNVGRTPRDWVELRARCIGAGDPGARDSCAEILQMITQAESEAATVDAGPLTASVDHSIPQN
ncbi:unnamed protein product [Amoebophrya sp. A120]|nr:unnamed protein product [Amoebophrya sp. A120]|eukprot:GSA120T00005480001.1